MTDKAGTRGGRMRQSRKGGQGLPIGRKLIVTIGIDAYEQMPRLHNAVRDARGIHQLFTETLDFTAPFPPLLDADATERNINALIQDRLPKATRADDAVVIFFAGHGVTHTTAVGDRRIETGFLVPVNAGRDQWSDYINMDHFLDNVSRLPARHVLVILDACHSGFALGEALLRFRDVTQYEQALLRRNSRRVITSAMDDQRALDGGPVPGHSLFTGSLIHGVKSLEADIDNNGLITVSELSLYLQSQVGQQSGSQQTPDFGWFKLDDRGELVLRVAEGVGLPPQPIAPSPGERSPSVAPPAPAWETLPFEPKTVPVPAGDFLMGDDDDPHAAPQHTVYLPDYRIGLYPVTNAQFADFIWKTGRVAAKELLWDGNQPPDEQREHPVTGVTWYDALAYCQWLSDQTGRAYRLPSEAQWEKAARGSDGRRYPWGNKWDLTRCHTGVGPFAPVDAYPAQSPYGCYDMVGNAREWTTTLWGAASREPDKRYAFPWHDDGRDDLAAPSTTRRVVRGGRDSQEAGYRCAARHSYLPDRTGPRRNRHGFRVVLMHR